LYESIERTLMEKPIITFLIILSRLLLFEDDIKILP